MCIQTFVHGIHKYWICEIYHFENDTIKLHYCHNSKFCNPNHNELCGQSLHTLIIITTKNKQPAEKKKREKKVNIHVSHKEKYKKHKRNIIFIPVEARLFWVFQVLV